MFGFGKKNTKKTPTPAEVAAEQQMEAQIHVMPERFYIAQKKNHLLPFLLLGTGILVVGALGGVAFYLNESLRSAQVPTTNTTPTPVTPVNRNTMSNQ